MQDKAAQCEANRLRTQVAALEQLLGVLEGGVLEQADRLEEAVRVSQSHAEALERSNADLEQFAYAASHDLQEPLRAIAGYCQLLRRDMAGKLDPKCEHYLTAAIQAALRMSALINDLLAFARVTQREQPIEPTDFNEAVGEALARLKVPIDESQAQVDCAPLPVLRANRGQIVSLFQNLIGNALKFRDARRSEIRITAQEKPNEVVFTVADNGIGIEPKHFERIFLIFQRLQPQTQYPGTGVGLALCKRIVERHGGRIWVQSKPGEGSAFSFTIRKLPASAAETAQSA